MELHRVRWNKVAFHEKILERLIKSVKQRIWEGECLLKTGIMALPLD